MLAEALNVMTYSSIFVSLFLVDYVLGNGFVDGTLRIFCKVYCFISKSIRAEAKQLVVEDESISFSVLLTEFLFLGLTMAFLNRYKHFRGKEHIDELLQESREALRQTNEFLEKWRLRKINWQSPSDYSYLDEEPQQIKPYKLEVPILHMAIIDTLGTTRSKPETGDAGDTINITDSTLLSVTSLLDEESIHESGDERIESRNDCANRYLWDVVEEDGNLGSIL